MKTQSEGSGSEKDARAKPVKTEIPLESEIGQRASLQYTAQECHDRLSDHFGFTRSLGMAVAASHHEISPCMYNKLRSISRAANKVRHEEGVPLEHLDTD
eukprot:11092557-Karenia_brevis.AAC.1